MTEQATGQACRPRYFDRQALAADDLNALVDWVRARTRQHNRHLVGWGVACGLPVGITPGSATAVTVGPGYAVMPSGEEVAVPAGAVPFDVWAAASACLGIAGPCPAPFDLQAAMGAASPGATSPIDFATRVFPAGSITPLTIGWATFTLFSDEDAIPVPPRTARFGGLDGLDLRMGASIAFAAPLNSVRLVLLSDGSTPQVIARNVTGAVLESQALAEGAAGAQTLTIAAPGIASISIQGTGAETILISIAPISVTRGQVWLALSPDETPSGFRPGVPDRCGPAGNALLPSRTCEGYRLRILCSPPADDLPGAAAIRDIICGPALTPCPANAADPDCVVIATLTIGDTGITAIDPFADRRRILPGWLLGADAEAHCTIVAPPPPSLPPSPPPPTPTPPPPSTSTTFTRFSEFTIFSVITPSIFTTFTGIFTQRPTFSLPSQIVAITRGPVIFDPGDPVIDISLGDTLAVNIIDGIGNISADKLKTAGIGNLADFVSQPSDRIAAVLGTSEVRVAGMQVNAIKQIVAKARGGR